jgi:hypothetical protein
VVAFVGDNDDDDNGDDDDEEVTYGIELLLRLKPKLGDLDIS